jgi:hypothetical protein
MPYPRPSGREPDCGTFCWQPACAKTMSSATTWRVLTTTVGHSTCSSWGRTTCRLAHCGILYCVVGAQSCEPSCWKRWIVHIINAARIPVRFDAFNLWRVHPIGVNTHQESAEQRRGRAHRVRDERRSHPSAARVGVVCWPPVV